MMTCPRRVLFLFAAFLSWALIACSGAQDEDTVRDSRDEQLDTPIAEEPAVEQLTGAVRRQDLLRTLGRSAGEFFRLIRYVEEIRGGSLVGWRLLSLPETQPSWIDVQPDDVVTAINGISMVRPDDAQQIWETLQVASEIRIDLLRSGESRSVRIPIEDGPAPDQPEEPSPGDEPRGPEE